MENTNIPTPENEKHWNKVFGFICYFGTLFTLLMAALIFLPIPEKNEQKATMTLSYIFGLLSGVLGVIIYSNNDKKKDTPAPGTSQSSVTVTKTEIPSESNQSPQNT